MNISHLRTFFTGPVVAAMLALALALAPAEALATFRYGPVQLSGNIQTQNLFRTPDIGTFDLVQQRNTLRLQYEHHLIERYKVGEMKIPFIKNMHFFAYYRGVYDSVFDIAPGGLIQTGDGSRGGKFEDIRGGDRRDIATENVLREVFLDIETPWHLSFRIGRQQLAWGQALNFRALDSVNALDLSWHLIFEAGLFGKVGFDELRIPAWTIKALWDIGSVGPFSNTFVEAYTIPFDFQPTELRFNPAPWSFPLRDPFRAGLVLDLGPQVDLPPGLLLAQVCFDTTGSTAANGAAEADFSESAETGFCNAAGLQESKVKQGLYDRRSPKDVLQAGGRIGAVGPANINFTLNYLYRRSLGPDVPGTINVKAQLGAVNDAPQDFLQLTGGHQTTDPITRETQTVSGYLRVPIEFYYPYVHVFGMSANYYEEYTGAVIQGEASFTKGVPIATAFAGGNGINRKNLVHGAIGFDRPTWIRWLNKGATWLVIFQMNFMHVMDHQDMVVDAEGHVINGDVQAPNAVLIPEQFGSEARYDRLKEWELLSLMALTSFYKGGSVVPQLVWLSDWANAPNMGWIISMDYLPTNNIILTPAVRIFTAFGRTVDEPFGLGRSSKYSEVQLKATYQF